MKRRVVSFCTLLAAFTVGAGSHRVHAADPTTVDCLGASEAALKLGNDHKVRAERAQLLVCAAASCPADIRKECGRRVEEVNPAIPTIIFEASDGAGNDLSAVKVSMDGEVLAERLDGVGLAIDPGEHTFVFETPGQPPLRKRLVIRESVKDRRESVDFGAGSPVKLPPPTNVSLETKPREPWPAGAETVPTSSSVAAMPSTLGVQNSVERGGPNERHILVWLGVGYAKYFNTDGGIIISAAVGWRAMVSGMWSLQFRLEGSMSPQSHGGTRFALWGVNGDATIRWSSSQDSPFYVGLGPRLGYMVASNEGSSGSSVHRTNLLQGVLEAGAVFGNARAFDVSVRVVDGVETYLLSEGEKGAFNIGVLAGYSF